MRRFINGKFAGTRLEIMPSKAATQLPDGTPISAYNYDEAELIPAQVAHRLGNINVHERQVYVIEGSHIDQDIDGDETRVPNYMVGPSIAQQWKNEYNAVRTQRGWTARYYREDTR